MNKMPPTRKRKTYINIITALFSHILIFILSFYTSRVIKVKLGLGILGLNGFFTNIISILSISELGIGTAITFALYKPLADDDKETIKSLMLFYKKAYRYIALSIAVLGIIFFPFIPHFIKNNTFSNQYIYITYFLFLFNSVLSYLFIYKRTLIIADQKNYIINSITLIYTYLLKILQLIVVYFTSSFILFLLIQIISTFGYNLAISIKCDKVYPYLNDKPSKLDEKLRITIFQKIKALFYHCIGYNIVTGTDNILIAFFCGIYDVGRYTSYLSLINMISTLIVLVFDNLKDSLGNFLVTETKEKQYDLFKKLLYLNMSLISICGICLLILLTPFIRLWLGDDTVLPNSIVTTMVFCFFISKSNLAVSNTKSVAGLFEQDKFVPIAESVINLGVSIVLSHYFGLIGIILGTIISFMLGPFWSQPIIVYKNIFKKNPISYFFNILGYLIRFILIFLLINYLINNFLFLQPQSYLAFFIEASILFIIVTIIWIATTFWKEETRYYFKLLFRKKKEVI